MKTPSDRPIDCKGAGQGYLHRLSDPVPPPPPPKPRPKAAKGPVEEYLALPEMLDEHIAAYGASLGVSVSSLRRLGCRWSFDRQAACFPMMDWRGNIVGIRLRNNAGRKWAISGSHAALFLPDGGVPDQITEIWICEGPTDCAALLDLDVYAIGRPSCSGGTDLITPLAASRDVVIMADADEWKTRPDGTRWKPGKDGAEALAGVLILKARTVKMIYPLAGKDVREWYRGSISPAVLRCIATNTRAIKKPPHAPAKHEGPPPAYLRREQETAAFPPPPDCDDAPPSEGETESNDPADVPWD